MRDGYEITVKFEDSAFDDRVLPHGLDNVALHIDPESVSRGFIHLMNNVEAILPLLTQLEEEYLGFIEDLNSELEPDEHEPV